ncbi:MAG: hypothetical protein NTV21_02845 [Planctomycetota bacterium]|nr:hypothetical protein [Planctomycetota bacterium]
MPTRRDTPFRRQAAFFIAHVVLVFALAVCRGILETIAELNSGPVALWANVGMQCTRAALWVLCFPVSVFYPTFKPAISGMEMGSFFLFGALFLCFNGVLWSIALEHGLQRWRRRQDPR